MPALKGQHRRSKSSRSNPYADRGLDQFALVSAELQETRERLFAQFGTSLSLVRFTIGPDETKWIPIIVSQTSSKAEIRALRRAASDLITGEKYAFNAGKHIVAASGDLGSRIRDNNTCSRTSDNNSSGISDNNTHVGSEISEGKTHLGSKISETSFESRGLASIDEMKDVGVHTRITKASERSSWMSAIHRLIWMLKVIVFSSRILADIVSNAVLSRRHSDDVKVRNLASQSLPKDESVIIDHASTLKASSSQPLSHLPPRGIAKDDIKRMKPPPSLHVEASKMKKVSRFPSAPASPRASRQLTKPFQACISLPKMHSGRFDPHIDINENDPAQKMVPNKVLRSPTSMAKETLSEKERKEISEKSDQRKDIAEKLGQALTGAGLMVILSGLVMGYAPAIIGVVCWWYLLPRMRKAVGDKPYVRSHHHHSSQEDRNTGTVNNKARGRHVNSVAGSGKEDVHSHDHKKRNRHRHHSQA